MTDIRRDMMNTGWWIISLLLVVCLVGCSKKESTPAVSAERPQTDCLVRMTPMKSQGRSDFCWIYAMLATIESEHLLVDDSVNLSAHFLGRRHLEEQAERVYLSCGKKSIVTRGMAQDAIDLMMRGGLTHFDAFQAKTNYRVTARKVEQAARQAMAQRTGLEQMKKDVGRLLDEAIHPAQERVYWLGAEYSPLEFAHSVCLPDEYIAMTSFTHHPFGERFALEVPDNHGHHAFLNMPLDSLMHRIEGALRSGHPVCWEGDTSEPGFSFKTGFAQLANEKDLATQESRQQMLDRLQTTDDHCMELVGMAHTRDGKRWFIAKNSWGTHNPFGGLMYLSENYVRAKTLAVWMSWKALDTKSSWNS